MGEQGSVLRSCCFLDRGRRESVGAFCVSPRDMKHFTSLSLTFWLSCLWGPLWS